MERPTRGEDLSHWLPVGGFFGVGFVYFGGGAMTKRTPVEHSVSPIVMAVRDLAELPLALSSSARTIFLLSTSLSTVEQAVAQAKADGRDVYVHADLVDGLGKDSHAMRWLANSVQPTGILSTRTSALAEAKSLGLVAVQRIFLVDSQALKTAIHLARQTRPDFVEVMPGVVPEGIRQLVQQVPCPVIAGGLCKTVAHYMAARRAGAVAISTSSHALWEYQGDTEVVPSVVRSGSAS